MAMPVREQFSALIDSEVLARIREIANHEGRDLDELVEHALRTYASAKKGNGVREDVMAHFWNSLERNRELAELLAKHDSRGARDGGC